MTFDATLIGIIGGALCLQLVSSLWKMMERDRARTKYNSFHGEAIDLSQFAGEGTYFVSELVRLEAERIREKHEALTLEEREAASFLLDYLLGLLPITLSKWQQRECWQRGRNSKAFAQKGLSLQKAQKALLQERLDNSSPAALRSDMHALRADIDTLMKETK